MCHDLFPMSSSISPQAWKITLRTIQLQLHTHTVSPESTETPFGTSSSWQEQKHYDKLHVHVLFNKYCQNNELRLDVRRINRYSYMHRERDEERERERIYINVHMNIGRIRRWPCYQAGFSIWAPLTTLHGNQRSVESETHLAWTANGNFTTTSKQLYM